MSKLLEEIKKIIREYLAPFCVSLISGVVLWFVSGPSEDNLRYFYSALFQSNAALISIVLIIATFRLQSLSNAVDRDIEKMNNYAKYEKILQYVIISESESNRRHFLEEVFKKIDSELVKKDGSDTKHLNNLMIFHENCIRHLDRMDSLKAASIQLLKLMLFAIFIPAILLVFLHEDYKIFDSTSISIVIGLFAFILQKNWIFCSKYLVNRPD